MFLTLVIEKWHMTFHSERRRQKEVRKATTKEWVLLASYLISWRKMWMIMMSQSARVALDLLCSPNRQMAAKPLDSIVMRHLIRIDASLGTAASHLVDNIHPAVYMINNQHDALFIFSLLSYHTSTCFGLISSPSSGGRMYICGKWYLLYFCVDCHRAGPSLLTVNSEV
jgi:hypothetical protein